MWGMRRRAAVVIGLIGVGLGALVWGGCEGSNEERPEYVTFTEEVMTTAITVVVPEDAGREAAAAVFEAFREVDGQMSEWKADSALSAVNQAAGKHPVQVPEDLRRAIRRGIDLGDLTNGAFDVTWAALWGLWDFRAEEPRVPDEDEVRRRRERVDYRKITIDEDAGTVFLAEEGMVIGLGGIAKGYALDRAAAALRERGVGSFLISAGGQMMLGGTRGDRPWRVGIRDPRQGPEDYFAFLELTDTSISTSGDYERYFVIDGVRYHHVLDPRTGKPARGLRSATVICADATLADALSTGMMILGREDALRLGEALDGVEAVLVDDDAGVHVTSGLAGKLQERHPPTR